MDPTTILLFVAAAIASLFMAWVIGAGSSGATPFAPAVGADAIATMRAAFVVGILGFAGAVTQGGNVSAAVGRGLIGGVTLPVAGVIIVLLVGAGLMAVGIRTGYPIATAFTVTGSVIGVGLAIGGTPVPSTYLEIGAVWLLTPFVGGGIAFAIASVLPRSDVPESRSVPLLVGVVGAVLANVGFAFLGPDDGSGSIAVAVAEALREWAGHGGPVSALGGGIPLPVGGGIPITVAGITLPLGRAAVTVGIALALAVLARWDVRRDQAGGLRRVLLALGALVAFSAGGSQVGLAVGPLVPLFDTVESVPSVAILVGGGLGILVGSWTGAPRMISSLAQEYSSLGPRRSIAALVPSFLIAQLAVLLGVPVSFNEIIVSAMVGSGAAVGGWDAIDPRKIGLTILAWIASFAVAFLLGYGIALAAI
ncbi:inorganic phosphate transporter, PiT family [Halopenitus malekzadehii]|uniref:Phosphate transporter n=1 Tax=Halopenitus malekzadehii TaxID=1267564 RepID=A0A1H6HS39_9EURY|nr:inorganic phosphate transporter [Halopenitus malekzadehii]SEH36998.1 inorganic phosphate transporter, PiT family [Halopenitus malekzadehii]